MNIEAGNAPFACLHELIKWQQSFLLNLRACISDRVQQFSSQSQFASVLLSLADLFIDSADHFKQYSAFCAAHAHALRSGGSLAVLNQRSLNNSSGSQESLGSLLIRPVQRVLRYPLLLQQLRSAANAQSVEQERLGEALAAMENVAGHMNEMQRVHDEFGAIFEHLTRQQAKGNRWPVAHLSTVDLLHYGTVTWTNAAEFLGKLKKGVDLHALCFVFRSAVVFLCKERIRQKKRLVVRVS